MLILAKGADGSVEALELSDLDDLGRLQALEAELGRAAGRGGRREPRRRDGSRQRRRDPRLREPLGGTVRVSRPPLGGQLIANGRIPIQAIIAAVEADEALDEGGDDMPLRPGRVGRVGMVHAPVGQGRGGGRR